MQQYDQAEKTSPILFINQHRLKNYDKNCVFLYFPSHFSATNRAYKFDQKTAS